MAKWQGGWREVCSEIGILFANRIGSVAGFNIAGLDLPQKEDSGLNADFSSHVRMRAADIRISARLFKPAFMAVAGEQRLRFGNRFTLEQHRMIGTFFLVDPAHSVAGFNHQRFRLELHVDDAHLTRFGSGERGHQQERQQKHLCHGIPFMLNTEPAGATINEKAAPRKGCRFLTTPIQTYCLTALMLALASSRPRV